MASVKPDELICEAIPLPCPSLPSDMEETPGGSAGRS